MGPFLFSKTMALKFPFAVVLSLLFTASNTSVQSNEEGFIAIDISNKGLDFVKDLLVEKAISSLVPVQLPKIEKSVKIPVIGNVNMVLSNITIFQLGVSFSTAKTGDTGIVIAASGATANLTMDWEYTYTTWLLPIAISDKGVASVQVAGMEAGLTVGLKSRQGSLGLSVMDCGCYVKNIHIELEGGASWLYQGLVDAFEGEIDSAVENAIAQKIKDEATKLNSLLQSLPREVSVNQIGSLNVTLVNEPILSNSSVDLEIDGLFIAKDEVAVSDNDSINLEAPVSCLDKMVGISLHETVLNSASLVYFNAGLMHWIIDKIPHQSLLNTAEWRYVIPQLYRQYPNDDMDLNISLSSPPIIRVENQNIDAKINSDVILDVRDGNEIISVACMSVMIRVSTSAEILKNTLAGVVRLQEFTLVLKWSRIGRLHVHLLQSIMLTILKTVGLPYVNLRFLRGFPLPIFHGYTLQDAQMFCDNSRIIVCSNVGVLKTLQS